MGDATLSDLTLLERARRDDRRAADEILRRYDQIAHGIAYDFFHPSLQHDDLHQEALIGVLSAIRHFRADAGIPFEHFVRLCIRRRLITALKGAQRGKHAALTDSRRVTLVRDEDDDEPRDAVLSLIAPGEISDRAEWRDEVATLARKIRVDLSSLEARCLLRFANGQTYDEIAAAERLADGHTVDRALTRARWKLTGEGPPSSPSFGKAPRRTVYVCPRCGGATVKRKAGRGRPPLCNVCRFQAAA